LEAGWRAWALNDSYGSRSCRRWTGQRRTREATGRLICRTYLSQGARDRRALHDGGYGRSLPRFGVGGISFALVAHLSTDKVVRAELKVLVGTSGWVESGRMSAKAGFSGSAAPTISPPGCKAHPQSLATRGLWGKGSIRTSASSCSSASAQISSALVMGGYSPESSANPGEVGKLPVGIDSKTWRAVGLISAP
jgi:hypothetical protein